MAQEDKTYFFLLNALAKQARQGAHEGIDYILYDALLGKAIYTASKSKYGLSRFTVPLENFWAGFHVPTPPLQGLELDVPGGESRAQYFENQFSGRFATAPPQRPLTSADVKDALPKTFTPIEAQLDQASATVTQLSAALEEAKEVQQAMLHLAQLKTVRQAHAEVYGPDPETGQTAAQEYASFKRSQREQKAK